MPVAVTLSQSSTQTVTVDYDTQDGAPPGAATTAHNDYNSASGTVTFTPGQTSQTIPITVNASGLTSNAGFSVILSNPVNATISVGTATVQITNQAVISGSVEDHVGKGIASVPIAIAGASNSSATTDSNGNYSVVVNPGSYTVTAQPSDGRYVPQASADCSAQGNSCAVVAGSTGTVKANFVTALAVDSVAFQQHNVSDNALAPVPASGTYDGNVVEVDAKISNISSTPQTTQVSFTNVNGGQALAAANPSSSSVTVPANSTTTATFDWDTSSLAWSSSGAPTPENTVRATLSLGGAKEDESITIRPKPVILVHGFASDYQTWAAYLGSGGFIAQANSYWQAFAVGDGQAPGVMNTDPFSKGAKTIYQNAQQMATYIEGVRNTTNAWHVDIVAHSMGGIISRQYVDDLMPTGAPNGPVVTHLAMLGTPNEGSPCAYLGTAALALAGLASHGQVGITAPILELEPSAQAVFNSQVANTNGVAFSILAGDALPTTCGVAGAGDLVVPIPSALWTIGDSTVVSGLYHTDMTSSLAAFNGWILPHLEKGGQGTGSASATLVRSAVKKKPKPKKPVQVCKQSSGGLGSISSAGLMKFSSSGDSNTVLAVSSSQALSVTVMGDPALALKLVSPTGKVVAQSPGGNAQTGEFFRSLSVKHSQGGNWHLLASNGSSSTEAVYTAVETKPQLVLKASISTTKAKRILLSATLTKDGHKVSGAKIKALLILITGKRISVSLKQHSPGHYQVLTSVKLVPGATQSGVEAYISASGAAGKISSLVTEEAACKTA